MTLARTIALLMCLQYAGATPSASVAQEAIQKLIGTWEGQGELFGRPAMFSMRWAWALEQGLVELRFENRLVQDDGSEQKVLEAIALYRVADDGTLSGVWFDSRGQRADLQAVVTADTIATHWTADDEQGRTTYRLLGDETAEVEDHVLGEEGWRPFGRATYRRVAGQRPAQGGSATMHASGRFEVKLKPLETYNQSPDAKVGRMSIDKTFEGELVATSQGEMLSGGAPAEGSAGYVAIERVTGTVNGRSGSFLLQHSGTMTPESQSLTITVVPASGTGDLEGIAGTMSIEIEDGQHFYELEYTLPSR